MFIEEDFETYAVNLLTTARIDQTDDTYDADLAKIKDIQTIAGSLITLENFSDFATASPAVVMGFMPEHEPITTLSTRNDSQMIAPVFRIFLITTGFNHPNEAYAQARPILRGLKNLFRGLRAGPSEGSADGYGRLMFSEQILVGQNAGVALYAQDFDFHTMDNNTTRRTL